MDAESTVAPINTDAEENSTDETDSDDSFHLIVSWKRPGLQLKVSQLMKLLTKH